MGNQSSCFHPLVAGSSPIIFISPDGEVRCVEDRNCTAADLMIEFPGHAVAFAEEVHGVGRVTPMKADEELRSGQVYLLVQVDRFGLRVSDRQMKVVGVVVQRRSRRRKGKRSGSDKKGFQAEAGKVEMNTGFAGKRVGLQQEWRPVLDTIHEAHSQ
ncbi:hypothetical protein J5N97_014080 [Dioscorea zingiberensis]|uniref:Uncharacterized protein n=1 Tax=Dioscorea zingiberensis TaxID=325984 RepID=A0A9D5CRQ7_9LILI|nr:hypothetical protein J5N97_014080 [Dioscorea zingiberensis]